MSELHADPLSPIDAATLWPQMRRLSTEVVATRSGENLLVASGLAATGLTNLPRVPRTLVLGVKRGLGYRGVLVARELSGGSSWEVVSLRIARDMDDEAVATLISECGGDVARRQGRRLFMRCPESTPHEGAVRAGGLVSYRRELLYALPRHHTNENGPGPGGLRPVNRTDRHGVFRLYARTIPEIVRRAEAVTLQEFRAVLDSYDCEREFVADGERGALSAWVGLADRECRLMVEAGEAGATEAALDCIEQHGGRHAVLVLGEDQAMESALQNRGYTPLGVRHVCARRLAVMNSLKEVVAVPAETLALPQ